jgi:transcriptional regulator with XRE-family HTH domain
VSIHLGNKLRRLRVENEITIRDLSRKIGLTEAAISQIENNKRTPSISSIIKIADFFVVSIDYLVSKRASLIFSDYFHDKEFAFIFSVYAQMTKKQKEELKRYLLFIRSSDKINLNCHDREECSRE